MPHNKTTVSSALVAWWHEQAQVAGPSLRLRRLVGIVGEFVRDCLPDRRRQRYGDADFDWDQRVNTTSANVSWRARFIGLLNSSYQPIEAEIFREMIHGVPRDFRQYTFIDIGSGKGRALLLASELRFRRVIGIELLPELNRIAQENIAKTAARENMAPIESICGDATAFKFPNEPLVIFLFHPLPEAGFRRVLTNLRTSLDQQPRSTFIVYANPVFEMSLAGDKKLRKITGTQQWVVYEAI